GGGPPGRGGAHATTRDAVIAGEHQRVRSRQAWRDGPLDRAELGSQRLEPPQGAERLGEGVEPLERERAAWAVGGNDSSGHDDPLSVRGNPATSRTTRSISAATRRCSAPAQSR